MAYFQTVQPRQQDIQQYQVGLTGDHFFQGTASAVYRNHLEAFSFKIVGKQLMDHRLVVHDHDLFSRQSFRILPAAGKKQ